MGHHHRVGLFCCCCCSPFPPIAAQEAGNETERKTKLNAPHSDDHHVPASFVYITQSKLKLNQGTSTEAPSSEIFALEGLSLSFSDERTKGMQMHDPTNPTAEERTTRHLGDDSVRTVTRNEPISRTPSSVHMVFHRPSIDSTHT